MEASEKPGRSSASASFTINASPVSIVTVSVILALTCALLGGNIYAMITFRQDEDRREQRYEERFSEKVKEITDAMKTNSQEMRILGVHVQDQNAILLREGLIRPGDAIHGPTSGESKKND